ncbi:Cgr1 family [Popillia japonica]|uniref:Coiled-coil domain-containing protein 86 n=1 Tax=Popillia japonica TaxID=7064 RepID=A0AAW1NML9_POPJA
MKRKEKEIEYVPQGKPKSGRVWKTQRKKFFTTVKSRGIKTSFEKKKQLREELARVKQASREIIAAKKEEKQKKKERRRENLKRQKENQRKSEVVQVITNTSKLKKMKKKQLRHIEKRDTNI